MNFPSKETVERIKTAYSAGCRVELVRMDDTQAPRLMDSKVREQILAVRDTGLTNMFDINAVLRIAYVVKPND